MIKFTSIPQFRNVIKQVQLNHDYQGNVDGEPVYKHIAPYPTLNFKGTVKLHGTNAAVVKYKDRTEYQSRERVLTLTSDNAQFMLLMSGKNLDFMFDMEFEESIAVFGEWCGQTIQKGVAISQLPKMFVIFAVQVDGEWVDHFIQDPDQNIYHIESFPTFWIDIDFNAPEMAQNKLIEMTLAVEAECPVGKHFGAIGVGEGIVFTTGARDYIFKSKGEKHSVSNVKTLASVDVELIESWKEFVDYAVTENRLKQGIEYLITEGLEVSQKSTGDFLRWVVNDIVKEESDVIVKNGLDLKKLNPLISKKARNWFFSNY